MNTSQTNIAPPPSPVIEEYVARCSALLWDLSPELQDQLREDIRQIVGEVAMELDGRPDDLVGPPLRFVSELRRAAGLPEIPTPYVHPQPPPPTPESAWVELGAALWEAFRTARSAAWPWTKQLLTDLRPAWWVARGIGLAFILGAITGWYPQGLLPNLFNSQFLGLFSTAGLIVASVQMGRKRPTSRLRRLALFVLSIGGFIALVGFSEEARHPEYGYGYEAEYSSEIYEEPFVQPLAAHEPRPSENIIFAKANNGLVNFVDPITGVVLESVDPNSAQSTAEYLGSRYGEYELVVEFQGHQRRAAGFDLAPLVNELFR